MATFLNKLIINNISDLQARTFFFFFLLLFKRKRRKINERRGFEYERVRFSNNLKRILCPRSTEISRTAL